jgi:hypothetical protein
MADLGNLDALKWIDRKDGKERGISENSFVRIVDAEFRELVRQLYDAGAAGVVVMDVTDYGDTEDGSHLKVTLPDDVNAREKLFEIEKSALAKMGSSFIPEGDHGQDSFMLGW